MVASTWLEGSYGGIPSHVAPETPGSIHEGGELGYALAHACGAVLDNPELLVACVIGDGEAETGPLAASWHSNEFINPASASARPCCARRWSTSAWRSAPTHARTATTPPPCATGSDRPGSSGVERVVRRSYSAPFSGGPATPEAIE